MNQSEIRPIETLSRSTSSNEQNHHQLNRSNRKRARFVDETIDRMSINTFFTFQHDDPPTKKLRQIDQSQLSPNHPIRRGIYLDFIDTALCERSKGHLDRYDQLMGEFDPLLSSSYSTTFSISGSDPTVLRILSWVNALGSMVSRLDRSHSALVNKVVRLPWTILGDEFANEYCRFVLGLVSSRSDWIQSILQSIVRGFQYKSVTLENQSVILNPRVNRRLIYQRLHSLLRSILRLIPTLPSILWPILDSHFPNKRQSRDSHVCYTTNLLRIATYCLEISDKIIRLCIDRCIKLDVEIQVEIEDWQDSSGKLEEEIFGKPSEDPFEKPWRHEQDSDSEAEDGEEVDFEELSSAGEEDGDGCDQSAREANLISSRITQQDSIRKVKELAAKLDAMMRCIFDHLYQINFGQGAKLPGTENEDGKCLTPPEASQISVVSPQSQIEKELMFDVLISTFETSILKTRRTRYTQFLIFWYASLNSAFTDSFLASLVDWALYVNDENLLPVVTRLAAVGYIASLVSRAKYIDKLTTRHVVALLCAKLDAGLAYSSTRKGKGRTNATWYAIAQAIFYIFCFRWKDLMVGDDDHEEEDEDLDEIVHKIQGRRWLNELGVIEKAIISPLNPLKVCAPTVVTQFAKVSHQTNFFYCYNYIRNNEMSSRLKISIPSSASSTASSTTSLSSPMLSLPVSRSDYSGGVSVEASVLGRGNGIEKSGSGVEIDRLENKKIEQILKESQIDSFFPFDPFRLPLSCSYVDNIYRVWEGLADDDDDDDDDEGQDQEDESDTNDDNNNV
ncbi:RNA polymerase I-specific transcription initiation factor RRN3 [Phakopsora pachyrhizi]|uniref:RNA polymerase I-specific transcription initiation factor RRN3 n=1 Tax=Phakopsora pachyrhizi TaxID=170000 RepID=A0AAV0AE41_PHAPC|nr:RNA polymerase I-specific transcription initiation factor RRN3 [Phakopsora pachyrhizi]KAI8457934.1 RNA polymerase I-specific transcription initiation factor RRN3 [Phakopsora pachyrhizi]CAH7666026.1 RNA polymerase I-specific transcription initiation factor RRN3 [Phakopsora pachyrhizi]CAH7666128.1 RNA polymerase I-specific transcription initiation factor RRN3 [Phakopsora pachyrhizi]